MVGIGLADFACSTRRADFYKKLGVDFAKFFPLRRNIIFVIDSFNWTDWLASSAVDTLIRLDVKHSGTLVNAIDRALFDTRLIFNINTRFGNYVSHEESSIWVATAVNCNGNIGVWPLLTTVISHRPFGWAPLLESIIVKP